MKTNQEYKNAALAALKGNWAAAVVATVIYVVIAVLVSGGDSFANIMHFEPGIILTFAGVSCILGIFILFPLAIGLVNAFRVLYESGDAAIASNMFSFGFKRYLHTVWVYFLMELKIFLWMLLLIVPGFIMAFAYAMTPYIAIEHPEYSASECISASKKMMKGHKFDLLWLYLSFIGWFLLCILTLGIGAFWLEPYVCTAQAAFYNDLKSEISEQAAVTE